MEQCRSGAKEKPSFLQRMGIRNSKKLDTHLENGNRQGKKKNKSNDMSRINEIFNEISRELPQYVIGQTEYINDLVIAFKRSYLVDNEKSYRNMMIITGPAGTGKNYSVKVMAKLLSIAKLTKNSSIYTLDFSAYVDQSSMDKLFYPDMYRAFYSDAPIVVFNNFDMACEDIIRAVSVMGIEGKLKTNKRFGWNRGEFQENTGSYIQGVRDYISANEKFIVLITDKKKNYIDNMFSTEFFSHVYDVLETIKLKDEYLIEITEELLSSYADKIETATGISIFDNNFVEELVSACDKNNGMHSIEQIIEQRLYQPIVELCIKKKISEKSELHLTIDREKEYIYANEYKLGRLDKGDNEALLLEAKQQLDELIGLASVKEFINKLEENISFQKKYNKETEQSLSLHMVFYGNPGTGKTTVARIIAKYLKALGILSEGQMIEVTRSDLVGQFVGETAQKTLKKINEATGGILFIDEAYSLVLGKNDVFGIEAIDTLVKKMEDYRDNMVVIAAGYTQEMQTFLDANSGMRSRFNYIIEFPDYIASDMLDISIIVANKASYIIDESCTAALLEYYQKTQIPGKKDCGNGRLARNIVEKAITNHSHRLIEEGIDNPMLTHVLDMKDFGFDSMLFDLETELGNIIGLEKIKALIRNLNSQLKIDKMRREAGFDVNTSQSLNMLFLGNPGTGKTYVARLMARLLKESGFLKSDIFIEIDRSGLVAEYVGQTAQKTKDVFEAALGGVLFIDEAYSLSAEKSFDKEAIDTLVKLIEDNAGNIVVILAGYKREMSEFLNSNSGLKSRFSLVMDFPDYSVEELYEILCLQAEHKGFNIKPSSEKSIKELLIKGKRNGEHNGNARMARNILEEAIRKQTNRLTEADSTSNTNDLVTLLPEDFEVQTETREFDLEARLSEIVGIETVKEYLRSLYNMLRVDLARKQLGIETEPVQTLHMIFTGNPGTGKTTMARIIGEIFYELGILSTKNFVETDRAGLVAGYVGQTALKTKSVIMQALDGILFIDEAYSLSNSDNSNDFGIEAINTLVKDMDDYRDRLVVILAGYTKEMNDFLDTNAGLRSRFPNVIEFPNYSSEELLLIAKSMLAQKKYNLSEPAMLKLKILFETATKSENFGNGRFARNVCEKIIRNLSTRISKTNDFTIENLTTIIEEDIY